MRQTVVYPQRPAIPKPFGLASVPDNFDLTSPGLDGGYANLMPISQWNWNPANLGQNLFLPAEKQFGLGDRTSMAQVPLTLPSTNFVEKVYPRGSALAPQTINTSVIIFQYRIPQAGKATLNSFCWDIDNTLNLGNYVVDILASGTGIMNKGDANANTFRGFPCSPGIPVDINYLDQDEKFLQGGTLIQVVVRALATIANNDNISASLNLSVWPDLRGRIN